MNRYFIPYCSWYNWYYQFPIHRETQASNIEVQETCTTPSFSSTHIWGMIYRVCEREREKDKEGLCTEISCVWGSLCARARPCPQTITPYRIRLPLRARCQLLELNMVLLHMNRLDFNVSPCFRGVYCRFIRDT